MCKIAFSHIIQENSLQKGLFQLIANQDQYLNQECSTDNSQENFSQTLEDIKLKKNQLIQNEILEWFQEKMVLAGNPEDLIYKHVQKQKAIILPKKSEVIGLSGNKMKMNNLLSRRTTKLLEVNVSG